MTNILSGSGRFEKTGSGTATLTGNSTAFTGMAAVTAGTLAVNGTLGDTTNRAASILVGNGTVGSGTLGGSGTIAGSVNILAGGTLSAGNSPGTLSTGNLTLATGATLTEEITGTTAGAYDRVNVTGSVSLAGTLDLRVSGAFASTVGQNLVFIANDLTDTVTGRFDALTLNGTAVALSASNSFAVDSRSYLLDYAGGDGNDVAIRDITPIPSDPTPAGPTSGNDSLTGTSGPDTISLGQGADTFAGGAGNDLVYGNQGNDQIYGNQDADTLYGGQSDDRAFGGQGDDRLYGNLGNDVLFGNLGADVVYGNQGNDIVYGNQAADILFGGQGNDVLYGGQGDDTLVGGIGDDTLVGGLGADLYRFDTNSGRDLILGFNQQEGDRIALGGQTYTVSSAQNGDALLTLSGGGVVDLAGIRADQVNAAFFA